MPCAVASRRRGSGTSWRRSSAAASSRATTCARCSPRSSGRSRPARCRPPRARGGCWRWTAEPMCLGLLALVVVLPVLGTATPTASASSAPPVASSEAARSLLAAAAAARRGGDLRATLSLLEAAVELAPSVETHAALGGFHLQLGAARAAERHLRAAATGDPGRADRWIALARALALKPDPMAAAGALARARPAAGAGGARGVGPCGPGGGCTEYLGAARNGSYFRILVPDDWDGDLLLVNHGLVLDPRTIAPHHTCLGNPARSCTTDADCAGIPPQSCHEISVLGVDDIVLPMGKAVGASTFSQTSWAVFQSRFDLKAIVKFLRKEGPGRPRRIIVTGISGGGAVTVDATMRLKPGKMIHGATPLCSASAGGTPTVDAATDVRLVYDHLCNDVPGATFESLPDVGDPELTEIEFGIRMNTCLGWLAPSGDPVEAAAQQARREAMFAMTKIPPPNFNLVHVTGFSVLAMGQVVADPDRLNGRRPGWNEGIDYSSVFPGPLGEAFDAAVPRFGPGPGRKKMAQNSYVDFTRGIAKRVRYPILSFAGRGDHITTPEFQKVYDDAATYGGKDHALIWGSTSGHCVFTPLELRAVVEAYLEWLDGYRTGTAAEPTTADVLARCLALPGASPAQCNFDTAFTPPPLVARVPPRADWPEAAKNPLP